MARVLRRSPSATTQYYPTYQFMSNIDFDKHYDALLSHFSIMTSLNWLDLASLNKEQREDLRYRINDVLENELRKTYADLTEACKSLITEFVDYYAGKIQDRLEYMGQDRMELLLAVAKEEGGQTLEHLSLCEKKWMSVHEAYVKTKFGAEAKLREIQDYVDVKVEPVLPSRARSRKAHADEKVQGWLQSQSEVGETTDELQKKRIHRRDVGSPRTHFILDLDAATRPESEYTKDRHKEHKHKGKVRKERKKEDENLRVETLVVKHEEKHEEKKLNRVKSFVRERKEQLKGMFALEGNGQSIAVRAVAAHNMTLR
ncbi:hypothetical protein K491DRAFT_710066 [Lophiostoma macrostomum CBS 122681]|uniref:Uncharacterized protein n=1 Tax=Lophiostoma macrostomum CBS 122681 TaxID=1314788 RepID=A0A6A6TSH2_9PLEO|nr:hypothetical protein K491DRAFT_710066 [Lophiostoma macrostomum CBS 122681]